MPVIDYEIQLQLAGHSWKVSEILCMTAYADGIFQACAMGIANQEAVLRQYAENNGISNIAVYSEMITLFLIQCG